MNVAPARLIARRPTLSMIARRGPVRWLSVRGLGLREVPDTGTAKVVVDMVRLLDCSRQTALCNGLLVTQRYNISSWHIRRDSKVHRLQSDASECVEDHIRRPAQLARGKIPAKTQDKTRLARGMVSGASMHRAG